MASLIEALAICVNKKVPSTKLLQCRFLGCCNISPYHHEHWWGKKTLVISFKKSTQHNYHWQEFDACHYQCWEWCKNLSSAWVLWITDKCATEKGLMYQAHKADCCCWQHVNSAKPEAAGSMMLTKLNKHETCSREEPEHKCMLEY